MINEEYILDWLTYYVSPQIVEKQIRALDNNQQYLLTKQLGWKTATTEDLIQEIKRRQSWI